MRPAESILTGLDSGDGSVAMMDDATEEARGDRHTLEVHKYISVGVSSPEAMGAGQ